MDPIAALFDAVALHDVAARRRRSCASSPELSRCKNADTLPVLVFARYIGDTGVFDALLAAGRRSTPSRRPQANVVDRLRALLDADTPRVTAYSEDGFTALHFAAFYGARESATLLLERGADTEPVTKNFLANMPLHAAAAGGHRDVCALLLEHGANVNAKQHGGFTPLHTAGFRGDREMADLFLQHGADAVSAVG